MNFDYRLFTIINNLAGHHKLLDVFMVGVAKYSLAIYAVFLLYLWFQPGNRNENKKLVLKAVIAALIGLGINQVIGFFYFRPRPFAHHQVNMLIAKSPDPSFPSDHATGSAALTIAIFGARPLMGWLMTAITILLMVSRVYVGTHYPLDVLGGALTGLVGSLISGLLWRYFDKPAEKIINIYNRFIPL